MRKQQNRYLLLGCAFGVQLLCATKGYSNKTGLAYNNPVSKASSMHNHYAGETGRNEKGSWAKNSLSVKNAQEKISGKVTGPDGKGIAGVSVQIKGSKVGV